MANTVTIKKFDKFTTTEVNEKFNNAVDSVITSAADYESQLLYIAQSDMYYNTPIISGISPGGIISEVLSNLGFRQRSADLNQITTNAPNTITVDLVDSDGNITVAGMVISNILSRVVEKAEGIIKGNKDMKFTPKNIRTIYKYDVGNYSYLLLNGNAAVVKANSHEHKKLLEIAAKLENNNSSIRITVLTKSTKINNKEYEEVIHVL